MLGNMNAGAAAEHILLRNKLEDPMIAAIVDSHLIIRTNGIRRRLPGDFKGFQKWIQEQSHR